MADICKEHYTTQLEQLNKILGVQEKSATRIMAELGVSIKMFVTAAAVVFWCRLSPRNEESIGEIKSRRIIYGNKYLRCVLV